jgi:hypothetical protein
MKHRPIMTLGFAACLLMIAGTLSADTVEKPAGHRMPGGDICHRTGEMLFKN